MKLANQGLLSFIAPLLAAVVFFAGDSRGNTFWSMLLLAGWVAWSVEFQADRVIRSLLILHRRFDSALSDEL